MPQMGAQRIAAHIDEIVLAVPGAVAHVHLAGIAVALRRRGARQQRKRNRDRCDRKKGMESPGAITHGILLLPPPLTPRSR